MHQSNLTLLHPLDGFSATHSLPPPVTAAVLCLAGAWVQESLVSVCSGVAQSTCEDLY